LRRAGHIAPSQLREEFSKLKTKLEEIAARPFDRRPFLYFDIISWLESKVSGRSVQDVMQQKFLTMK
jgi:hypothetical protein